MILTCLECGKQRPQRDSTMQMNQRVTRSCAGRCGHETRHIAGLPPEHVHLTPVPFVVSPNARKKP